MTTLVIEFVRPDGQLLRMIDAGFEFIASSEIPLSNAERPLRIESDGKAKAIGLPFPSAAIPLPDGLQTVIQIAGKNLPMAGKPLSLKARVMIDGINYELTVSVTSQLNAINKDISPLLPPSVPKPQSMSAPPSPVPTVPPQSLKCPRKDSEGKECGGDLRPVRFKIGAGFNEFLGCSNYPQCDYKRSLNAR